MATMIPVIVDAAPIQARAYRALQLHPRAPLDLISEVYWLLAARASRETNGSAAESYVRELNRAYSALMTNARESESALVMLQSKTSRRGMLSLFSARPVPAAASSASDHYRTLCVDHYASNEIIELAWRYWLSRLSPTSPTGTDRRAKTGAKRRG